MSTIIKKRKLDIDKSERKDASRTKERKRSKVSPSVDDDALPTSNAITTLPPSTEAETKPTKTFQDLGIIKELCDACESLGFTAPRPIQIEAIPYALEGRDVIGLAETGSGKTAAFGLPMLQGINDLYLGTKCILMLYRIDGEPITTLRPRASTNS